MNIGDRVQTIDTLCPISGTVVEIWNNLIVISDDDAETDDDRLEFNVSDLEVLNNDSGHRAFLCSSIIPRR